MPAACDTRRRSVDRFVFMDVFRADVVAGTVRAVALTLYRRAHAHQFRTKFHTT
jgi:hypothetical protein